MRIVAAFLVLCLGAAAYAAGAAKEDRAGAAKNSESGNRDSALAGAKAGAAAPAESAQGSFTADYVLQPFDKIKVEVFMEPDLLRDIRLSQDSKIDLPLIKVVDLKGKTVREAQELIRALYDKDYLVNPQVNVGVTEYATKSVNVLGSVTSAGAVTIPPEKPLNVIEAITLAGGFNRYADRKKVKVSRTDEAGQTREFVFNTENIAASTAGEGWVLKPRDVIYVPEKIL